MASALFFVLTFLGFGPQKVGDELDADANEHIQQRVEMLQEGMMQLLLEIEKRDREHHRRDAMQAALLSVLLRWQFWFGIGVLVLFFWYLWRILRRIREPDSSSEEESSSDEEDSSSGEEEEESSSSEEEEESSSGEEEEENSSGEEEEESSSGEEEEESSSGEEEEEEQQRPQPNPNDANDLADYVSQRIYWPLPNPTIRCYQVAEVVEDLLNAYSSIFQESFFPELQSAIGVGSAFEGWSPRENDTVYRLLVPMTAPRGHSFHLELGKEDDILARNSSIRVELECTCAREQAFEDMLCFLHHSEDELKNQEPSLLDTLCTDSYLDAEKTARWFQNFVKTAWVVMPQSHLYNVKVLPSARSCKFQMTNATKRNLTIEIIFGVQQGNSDIFLSSQRTEAIITPSTTWPQSCAVAERKFFQHINTEAWFYSLHLKCMQICARMLVGTSISTYVIKTVVMHLLTSIPLETWHREDFLLRLDDIIRYLHCCLEEKRLNHFFFGNEMVPDVIALPPAFQLSGPVNLFEHLEQDTHAYTHMLEEFQELRNRLTRLMIYGH